MKTTARLLLSGLMAIAITLGSFAQTSLHYWDFNTGANGTPWTTPIPATQTIGGGSLSHPFGSNTDGFAGTTQDAAGFTTSTAGASFSVVSSVNNGQAFILTVPSTGYQDLKLTYSTRGTGTGFSTHTIDYTTDGSTYTNIATITGRTSTTFSLQTVDFTAVTAANNNPNFKIRITVSGATNTTGNNRIDNIRLAGTLIPSSTTMVVFAAGDATEGGAPGSFTIGLSPAPVADITVDYALTGSATFNTDYTVSFTGATSNSSTSSGTLTIPSGTSSATVTITPIDDAITETSETITLTLFNPGSGYTLSSPAASISLIDNDIATVSFTGNYTQDFNTLVNTGSSSVLPQGWLIAESSTNADGIYVAGDGSITSGNTYSFGTGTNTDRALGSLRSNALATTIGAIITNNTGGTLGSFQITYTGEQWRLGATGRTDKYDFQYSLNATSLANGTWTDADGLDFIAPIASGTVGGLDGNATANRTTITYTINGLSIPAGANFMVRWVDSDASGSDDGLGIDDVNFSLGCTPPTNQATVLNLTPALQSVSGSFTAAAAGTNAADSYLVLISSTPTLTDQPLSSSTYNVDDIIGNARVVSIGSTTSFTASGLTPSTTYYFFVYSAVGSSNCYNTVAPLSSSIVTSTPPACTPPATQASALLGSNITGTSIDVSFTRGSGDNVLVIARTGDPVNAGPINSLSYPVSTETGSGNFVVYNGSGAGFTHSGLSQNTTYHYAVYEYNSADFCYTTSPLTGNFTTACVNPVNISAFGAATGNGSIALSWTLPSGSCFDEIIIVASTAPVSNTGNTYTAPASTVYSGGEQVIYTGSGTSVTVTGLTNGTTYYFKAFTRKGLLYSAGVQATGTPFDPATGYLYLFGNIHAHSSYSDGNKDNTTKTPTDDFTFARDAECMDFLGISEHNHSGAGMNYPDFDLGYSQANAINGVTGGGGNSIVTLWGMEWGVISGGGHVIVYGFDNQLIGWETGNYDIYVAKNDYTSLWPVVNAKTGAFATLAHPNSTDYTNLAGSAYSATADNAIAGVAVESGPAFSTSTTYNDFPSSLSYLSYYKTLLAKGYHLSPQMDQDNHNLTFGTANRNRLVALTSAKSREALMEALRSGRYYASEDCNARVDYKAGAAVMGSQVSGAAVPSLSLSVTDPDGETVSTIDLWGGASGNGTVPSAPLKTYSGVSSITFSSSDAENIQPDNSTYYYFAIITQADGNKIVTAPIYYSRSAAILPLQLLNFTAQYAKTSHSVLLSWSTAQEQNTKAFIIERSADNGRSWTTLGALAAGGNSSSLRRYQYTDPSPVAGTGLYRLQMADIDGAVQYSPVRSITLGNNATPYVYSVYPNPAHGFTYLNTTGGFAEAVTVRISDNNGRLLSQQQYMLSNGTPAGIDLSACTPGIYFIRLVTAKGIQTQKIIVQ